MFKRRILPLFIASLQILACSKSTDEPTATDTCEVVINSGRLRNPYSVPELMQQQPQLRVQSTHTYEKIVIRNIAEYRALEEKGIILSEKPFDRVDADYTLEKEGQFPVAYAVVPKGVSLESFHHTRLDDLYMPAPDAAARTTANTFSGAVTFFNPISAVAEPIAGVKVIIKDVTRISSAFTDEQGRFTVSNAGFLSDTVEVLLEFSNNMYEIRTLDIANLQSIVFPNKYSLGFRKACGLTNMQINIGSEYANSALQYSMATLLSLNQFKKFAAAYQFKMPAQKMVFWLGKDAPLSDSYAAPMLNNIAVSKPANIQQLLSGLLGIPEGLAPLLFELVGDKLPDIYAPYYTRNTNNVPKGYIETLYHELGHAIHYAKVGNNFWNQYITYIFNNGGYGQAGLPNSGMIALSEAWAEDISNECAYYLYGNPNYLQISEKNYGTFITYGLYYDLYDNKQDTATIGGNRRIYDNVSGISFQNMYQLFTQDIITPQQYRQALKSAYPAQAVAIDSLYNAYQQ